jgi:mono/diheme cytochrome c family protein
MTRRCLFLPLLVLIATDARAQEDYFAFIPDGGRTILAAALAAEPSLAGLLVPAQSAEDWLTRITGKGLPGLAGLDDWQARTLADYLAYAGPIDPAALPPDGRDMTLERCQSCHIITVVVTQARAKAAWLGTLGKPSHVEIPLSAAERDQLADYLAVNAGIPIDAIPPELRAGGASY